MKNTNIIFIFIIIACLEHTIDDFLLVLRNQYEKNID